MACWPPCNPWCECAGDKCNETKIQINALRLRTRDGRYLYADNGGTDYKARLLATDVFNPVWETFLFIPPTKWPLTSGDSISLVVTDGQSAPTPYMVRAEYSPYVGPSDPSDPRGERLVGYDFGGPGTKVTVCGPLSTDIGAFGYDGKDEREWIFTIEKNGGGRINTGDEISLRITRRHSNSVPSAFYFRTAKPGNWAEIAADGTAPFQADTVFVVEFNEVRFGLGWRPSSINCQACGTVTGTVTDATTGQPIAGARVAAQGVSENHPFSATTAAIPRNKRGKFTLTDPENRTCIPAGNIRLSVTADRHQSKTIDPLTVPSEGGVDVPIQLDCTVVRGRVVDSDGNAVRGKEVRLRDQSSPPKTIPDEQGNPFKTMTAADGSFVFNCVPHRFVQVWTLADPTQMQHTKVVPPEGWTNVTIVVQVTCGNLIVNVTDADTGQAIKGATVTLANGQTATTLDNGSWKFPCVQPAGDYEVYAECAGYSPESAIGTVPTTGDTTVNIKLRPLEKMLQIWNTGVDENAAKLSPGSIDPHWELSAGPGINSPRAAHVVSDQRSGNYFVTTDSTWIWDNAAGSVIIAGSPYTFRLRFDLTGFDPASATITGSWGVDNDGKILLNGKTPVGNGTFSLANADINNYHNEHAFEITGGFQAGLNSLEIEVTNAGNAGDPENNPAGLNVTRLKINGSRVA